MSFPKLYIFFLEKNYKVSKKIAILNGGWTVGLHATSPVLPYSTYSTSQVEKFALEMI